MNNVLVAESLPLQVLTLTVLFTMCGTFDMLIGSMLLGGRLRLVLTRGEFGVVRQSAGERNTGLATRRIRSARRASILLVRESRLSHWTPWSRNGLLYLTCRLISVALSAPLRIIAPSRVLA